MEMENDLNVFLQANEYPTQNVTETGYLPL